MTAGQASPQALPQTGPWYVAGRMGAVRSSASLGRCRDQLSFLPVGLHRLFIA